jgi:hypothetical protein
MRSYSTDRRVFLSDYSENGRGEGDLPPPISSATTCALFVHLVLLPALGVSLVPGSFYSRRRFYAP